MSHSTGGFSGWGLWSHCRMCECSPVNLNVIVVVCFVWSLNTCSMFCVCIHTCVCAGAHVHEYICMGRPEYNFKCCSSGTPFTIFKDRLSHCPGIHHLPIRLDWLVINPRDYKHIPLCMPWVLCGFWGSNSGPSACKASMLWIEPSPQAWGILSW